MVNHSYSDEAGCSLLTDKVVLVYTWNISAICTRNRKSTSLYKRPTQFKGIIMTKTTVSWLSLSKSVFWGDNIMSLSLGCVAKASTSGNPFCHARLQTTLSYLPPLLLLLSKNPQQPNLGKERPCPDSILKERLKVSLPLLILWCCSGVWGRQCAV